MQQNSEPSDFLDGQSRSPERRVFRRPASFCLQRAHAAIRDPRAIQHPSLLLIRHLYNLERPLPTVASALGTKGGLNASTSNALSPRIRQKVLRIILPFPISVRVVNFRSRTTHSIEEAEHFIAVLLEIKTLTF